MESKAADADEREAEVRERVAERDAGLGGDPGTPEAEDDAGDVGERVDKLGDVVAVRVVELAPVWGC